MSKTTRGFLFGGLVFLGFWFVSKAKALATMVFTPGPVTNLGFQNAIPFMTLTVAASNTSGTSLRVNSIAGNVFSDGTLIGSVFSFTPFDIPANSRIEFPVVIQLQPLGLVNELINSFQMGNFTNNLSVNGWANVSGVQLPLILSYTVGNPSNVSR